MRRRRQRPFAGEMRSLHQANRVNHTDYSRQFLRAIRTSDAIGPCILRFSGLRLRIRQNQGVGLRKENPQRQSMRGRRL